MSRIITNNELCKGCGTCVLCCPETVFLQSREGEPPEVVREEICISCGQCVAICPQGAISHPDFPQGSIKPVNQDNIPSVEQILEMLKTRRSVRAFKDKPVEKEMIEKIVDGARFAPSGHNAQSTGFIVVQDKDTLNNISESSARYLAKTIKQLRNPLVRTLLLMVARHEIEGVLHLLPDFERIVNDVQNGKDTVLFNAPALLFFHADKSINFSDVNATLSLHNAALVIYGLGLGSFYAGYLVSACKRDDSIPGLLSLPKNHQIFGALAVGYPKFKFKNWIERKSPKIEWK